MASDGFNENGKGVLVVDKLGGTTEFDSAYVEKDVFLRDLKQTVSVDDFEYALDEYNPETQFLLVLYLKQGAKFYVLEKE